MQRKYQDWINKIEENVYARCREVTIDMNKAFPELKRVRGYYDCPLIGKREHWWLLDKDTI